MNEYWVVDWRQDPWTDPVGIGARCEQCKERKRSTRRDPATGLTVCDLCWFRRDPRTRKRIG